MQTFVILAMAGPAVPLIRLLNSTSPLRGCTR